MYNYNSIELVVRPKTVYYVYLWNAQFNSLHNISATLGRSDRSKNVCKYNYFYSYFYCFRSKFFDIKQCQFCDI